MLYLYIIATTLNQVNKHCKVKDKHSLTLETVHIQMAQQTSTKLKPIKLPPSTVTVDDKYNDKSLFNAAKQQNYVTSS